MLNVEATGSIHGSVEVRGIGEPNLPGESAIISAMPVGGGAILATTTANENGNYVLDGLPAGNYDVAVSRSGFATTTIGNVAVSPGGVTADQDFLLETAVEAVFGATVGGTDLDGRSFVAGSEIPDVNLAVTRSDGGAEIDVYASLSVSDSENNVIDYLAEGVFSAATLAELSDLLGSENRFLLAGNENLVLLDGAALELGENVDELDVSSISLRLIDARFDDPAGRIMHAHSDFDVAMNAPDELSVALEGIRSWYFQGDSQIGTEQVVFDYTGTGGDIEQVFNVFTILDKDGNQVSPQTYRDLLVSFESVPADVIRGLSGTSVENVVTPSSMDVELLFELQQDAPTGIYTLVLTSYDVSEIAPEEVSLDHVGSYRQLGRATRAIAVHSPPDFIFDFGEDVPGDGLPAYISLPWKQSEVGVVETEWAENNRALRIEPYGASNGFFAAVFDEVPEVVNVEVLMRFRDTGTPSDLHWMTGGGARIDGSSSSETSVMTQTRDGDTEDLVLGTVNSGHFGTNTHGYWHFDFPKGDHLRTRWVDGSVWVKMWSGSMVDEPEDWLVTGHALTTAPMTSGGVGITRYFSQHTSEVDRFEVRLVKSGAAKQLVLSGDTSDLVAGEERILTATLLDANGNVVDAGEDADLEIDFVQIGGSGTVSPLTPVVAQNGVAEIAVMGNVAGPVVIEASAAATGETMLDDTRGFEVVSGGMSELAIATQPDGGASGELLKVQPVLEVRDSYGNSVTLDNETEIAVSLSSVAGGTLGGQATLTVVEGIAAFGDLTLTGVVGEPYTLTFSDVTTGRESEELLAPVTSQHFTVTEAAEQLAFSQEPTEVFAGSPISPAVKVRVEDAEGNLIDGATDEVTISIGENPSGGVVSGQVSTFAVDGVATFDDLSIDAVGEGYTLHASAVGLTGAETAPFAVLVSAPFVNQQTGERFESMQEALDQAQEGAVIAVESGTYTESFSTDSHLTLGGDFTLFHSLGSITIDEDLSFAGDVRIVASNIHVAHGVTLTVEPTHRLILDGVMIDSEGMFDLVVEEDATFTLARSFFGDGHIQVRSNDTSIYDNFFTDSTIDVTSTGASASITRNVVDDLNGWLTVTSSSENLSGGEGTQLSAPAGVEVERMSRRRAKATWDAVPNAESYRIHRRVTGGLWSVAGVTTSPSFVDEGPRAPGGTYEYRVVATAEGFSDSEFSDSVPSTVPAVRLAMIGDSNLERGVDGTTTVAKSYIADDPGAVDPDVFPDHPKLLSGKIMLLRDDVDAVNHGIGGTQTGTGIDFGRANVLGLVDGVTRFEAEVLGKGYPWTEAGITRVNAFVPGNDDYGWFSLGVNDINAGVPPEEIRDNIAAAIDLWEAGGLAAGKMIIATITPWGGSLYAGNIPIANALIRDLVAARGAVLVDIAAMVSDDDGMTWKSGVYHTGDMLHYSEHTLDLVAAEVASIMDAPGVLGDGQGNVSSVAHTRNNLILELDLAPADTQFPDLATEARTVDAGGNIYVQPGDVFDARINAAKLDAPIDRVEMLMGYNSDALTVGPLHRVSPWDASGALSLEEDSSEVLVEIDAGIDASSATEGDPSIGSVELHAGADEGYTLFFFRVAQPGDTYDKDALFRVAESSSSLTPFTANTGLITIDGTPPSVANLQGLQEQVNGSVDIFAGGAVTRQGTVEIAVEAFDALAGVDDDDLFLSLTHQTSLESISAAAPEIQQVAVNGDVWTRYIFDVEIAAETSNGVYDVAVQARDRSGNESAILQETLEVDKDHIGAVVEIEGAADAPFTREVVFKATDAGGNVLKSWIRNLEISEGVGAVTLWDPPEGFAFLSAKATFSLRVRLPASLDDDGQAVVLFADDDRLRGGDLVGDNQVGYDDFSRIRSHWFTANEVADLTGNGETSYDDFNLLRANWFLQGDPE